MPFTPGVLSYEDLRDEAEEFLNEYHPDLTLPIPIETIVEFDLDMEVIPIPGLKAKIGVDAFLASDLSAIYMDEDTLQFVPARYRFSLAHEAGHWWLHDELYQDNEIATVADWRKAPRILAPTIGGSSSKPIPLPDSCSYLPRALRRGSSGL